MSLIVDIHFQRILHTKHDLHGWNQIARLTNLSQQRMQSWVCPNKIFLNIIYQLNENGWERKWNAQTGKKNWEKKTGKLNFIIKFILIPCRQHLEMWPTHLMDRDEYFSSVIQGQASPTHTHTIDDLDVLFAAVLCCGYAVCLVGEKFAKKLL